MISLIYSYNGIKDYKTEIIYDLNNSVISWVPFRWNKVIQVWENYSGDSRYDYKFNINGLLIEEAVFSFNEKTNKWSEGSKVIHTYNNDGRLIQTAGSDKLEYFYDTNGNMILIEPYWKTQYIPNANNFSGNLSNCPIC